MLLFNEAGEILYTQGFPPDFCSKHPHKFSGADPPGARFGFSTPSRLGNAFERVTHDAPTLSTMGGTTFAKAFPNSVSFGPVYPLQEKSLAHQADECLPVSYLVRNAKIYGAAIMLLATDLDGAKGPLKLGGQGLGL